MVTVRDMVEQEAEAVGAWWQLNCVESGGALPEEGVRRVTAHLRRNASHPDAFCLVAAADEELVGFLTASALGHPTLTGLLGQVEELFFVPSRRRQRVGRSLVEGALERLRARGADVFKVLVSTCPDGTAARAFWQALGWANDQTVFSRYEEGAPAPRAWPRGVGHEGRAARTMRGSGAGAERPAVTQIRRNELDSLASARTAALGVW